MKENLQNETQMSEYDNLMLVNGKSFTPTFHSKLFTS